MFGPRFRFLLLWFSQTARVLADNALRIFVILELAARGAGPRDAAWHLTAALLALPAIFLAPVNGALSNSLPKRWVLAASSAFCAATLLAGAAAGGAWVLVWGLVALAWAVFSPARYALLPPASEATGIPLSRVNGLTETGSLSATVAGLLLGWHLHGGSVAGLPSAVAVALSLQAASAVAAALVAFATDRRRPEPVAAALAGFFRDARRVLGRRESRASLLGLAALRGLVVALTGALVAGTLRRLPPEESLAELLRVASWVLSGVAAGSLLAGLQGHPARVLGLVPYAATGLFAGLIVAAFQSDSGVSWWLGVALGVMGGVANVPLAASFQADVPADARGNAMSLRNVLEYLAILAAGSLLAGLAWVQVVTPAGQVGLIAGLAALAAAVSWRHLYRPAFEQFLEIVTWPMYRVRATGPGLKEFPREGAVMVLANHAAWFDPVWLYKVLPRSLIPMMTSRFYDLPVLRWWMRHVVGAIRVEESSFRRTAPELDEAVAVLDRGEVLVVFPEGAMRRSEERPLRQFGQGVWHILSRRPDTPVVVCWIEGNWGTFTSYRGGPPTQNKRPDWGHPVRIAVTAPQTLDPGLLAQGRPTRAYLMRQCLEARRLLGLPPLAPDGPAHDEEEKD